MTTRIGPSLGVEIGDRAVTIVVVEPGAGVQTVVYFAKHRLPSGAVADGAVQQPDALIHTLRLLHAQFGNLGSAVFGISTADDAVRPLSETDGYDVLRQAREHTTGRARAVAAAVQYIDGRPGSLVLTDAAVLDQLAGCIEAAGWTDFEIEHRTIAAARAVRSDDGRPDRGVDLHAGASWAVRWHNGRLAAGPRVNGPGLTARAELVGPDGPAEIRQLQAEIPLHLFARTPTVTPADLTVAVGLALAGQPTALPPADLVSARRIQPGPPLSGIETWAVEHLGPVATDAEPTRRHRRPIAMVGATIALGLAGSLIYLVV